MEGPFGADRRDSAIAKRSSGILAKLENFLINNGAAEVREGISRQCTTSLNADYPVLALYRYYGLDALEQEIKEFYAVVDGASNASIKKYNAGGGTWDTMELPPNITLTTPANGASPGNFEQFKDRTYYTNQKESVLMIRKEDDQVYEAGIPDADAEREIVYMETLTGWNFYTNGNANKVRTYLDAGFERHTEGDYGLTLEQSSSGSVLSAIYTLPTAMNLEWFNIIREGHQVDFADTNGVLLTDNAATFTSAYIGLQVYNVTDGSSAVILSIESSTEVITTPLKGGTLNQYTLNDYYMLGTRSTESDYIAFDVFRFAKGPIDEFLFEVSEHAPTVDGHFVRGFYIVGYADTDYTHFSLRQRTMLAQWAMDPYSNRLFLARLRKKWFIPIKPTGISQTTHATTLTQATGSYTRARPRFTADLIGSTITNVTQETSGTITGVTNATTLTHNVPGGFSALTDVFEISSSDDFASIGYVKFHLMHNAQTTSDEAARVTVDNVRLLKSPPIPAQLSKQVATCDAQEDWTHLSGTRVEDNLWFSTEGVSCKKIPLGTTAVYAWGGTRDFSQYGEGTLIDGSHELVFDVGGELSALGSCVTLMLFTDNAGATVQGTFTVFGNLADVQQRSIHKNEFYPITGTSFDWENVISITVYNLISGGAFTDLYIDNIRFQPPSASKMINKFMPLDLIIGDALSKGIEHFFGENHILDIIADWLFAAYLKFTRKWVGQGRVVFPDYTHGRYKVGSQDQEHKTLACLGMQVDAGGQLAVTFTQDDDLTEYEDFNFNLDSFLKARQQNNSGNFLGIDWVEIPAADSDELSIWFSTNNLQNINTITIRFYANSNATYESDLTAYRIHNGSNGTNYVSWPSAASEVTGLIGKRIRNDSWVTGRAGNKWGIIGSVWWDGATNRAVTWGMSWNANDRFTIDKLNTSSGFKFNKLGQGGKPGVDKDNYYEHVIDIKQMVGSLSGLSRNISATARAGKLRDHEEELAAAREIYHQQGLQIVYQEQGTIRRQKKGFGDKVAEVAGPVASVSTFFAGTGLSGAAIGYGAGKLIGNALESDDDEVRRHSGWTAGIIKWKRSDMIPHLEEDSPWQTLQAISAHEIIVKANSTEDAYISFQDFKMTKKGAVYGEDLKYKIKLEDDQGFLGPSSESSYGVTATGNDISLTNIYIPYDNRIIRKRIYRTDQYGNFRLLDVIDRLADSYIDQIPEDLLGAMIEPDYHRPPKSRNMRAVDNRMAYIDCIDRRGTRRSSRIHLSIPFVPHQCDDYDCFDIQPEDGQRVIWCEGYMGYLIVWKERSMYTVDLSNFDKAPRDLSIGCIAPLSVAAIPNAGFGWLSHEGIMFGDQSNMDFITGEQIWDDIKGFTPAQLSRAVAWYKDRYYYIFFGYDTDSRYTTFSNGYYNGFGYACYLPNKTWTKLTNWNVQCVSVFKGGTDSSEVYAGSRYGYVNKLFDSETDLPDDGTDISVIANQIQIPSHLKAIDYDFDKPHTDKYLEWLIFTAKNLSADPARKALLTFTPYYDQIASAPMNDERIEHTTYRKYDLCHDPGDFGTLIGFELNGVKRYAIKEMTTIINDLGFRPVQQRGTY